MEEQYNLIYWDVVTDGGTYPISESGLEALLASEQAGARFFRLDKVVLNIAFIREIRRRVEHKDARFSSLGKGDAKFLEKENARLTEGTR